MKKNIILIGPAGSGKGTQADKISKKFEIIHISTGSMLRKEVKKETDVGKLVKEYVNNGLLVPDDKMKEILEHRLKEGDCSKKGFILDGFPRNLSQAIILEEILKKNHEKIDIVFKIEISKDVLFKRITGRYFCAKCGKLYNKFFENPNIKGVCDICGSERFVLRDDDINERAIKNRLEIYEKIIKELTAFYGKKGLIYTLDGVNTVNTVSQEILSVLSSNVKS